MVQRDMRFRGFVSTLKRTPARSRVKHVSAIPSTKERGDGKWKGSALTRQTLTKARVGVCAVLLYKLYNIIRTLDGRTRRFDAARLSNILYFCLSRLRAPPNTCTRIHVYTGARVAVSRRAFWHITTGRSFPAE